MNILVTAIGSMSAKQVMTSIKKNHKIVGCDIHLEEWLINAALADVFYQVPKARENDFIDTLLKICETEQIDCIIPLTDPEVDVLYENRALFAKYKIALPGKLSVEVGRDKQEIAQFFENALHFKGIPTYLYSEIEKEFPKSMIAKPKKGRSSEGIVRLENVSQLLPLKEKAEDYIFQPIINGKVITVDYIRDQFQNEFYVARRELIRTSNGAGLTVEVFEDERLDAILNEIGSKFDITGCINVEFIEYENEFYLLDFNPRFSAGVGFSYLAGYDFAHELINVLSQKEIKTKAKIETGIYTKDYNDIKIKRK